MIFHFTSASWVALIVGSELDTAAANFREILRQSWIRRAIRTLTTEQPLSLLHRITLADVTDLRDPDWEHRERRYHDTALKDLNSLVRNYNGVAPAAVRRAYYLRDIELQKAYENAAHDILLGIEERIRQGGGDIKGAASDSEKHGQAEVDLGPPLRIRDVISEWLSKLTGRRRS